MIASPKEFQAITGRSAKKPKTDVDRIVEAIHAIGDKMAETSDPTPVNVSLPKDAVRVEVNPVVDVQVPPAPEGTKRWVFDVERDNGGRIVRMTATPKE